MHLASCPPALTLRSASAPISPDLELKTLCLGTSASAAKLLAEVHKEQVDESMAIFHRPVVSADSHVENESSSSQLSSSRCCRIDQHGRLIRCRLGVFLPDSPFKGRWDLFIASLVIVTVLAIPLQVHAHAHGRHGHHMRILMWAAMHMHMHMRILMWAATRRLPTGLICPHSPP